MIHTYIPYCPAHVGDGANLGYAYNNFMSMIGEDDWACFLDHDAMFTTKDWYRQLEKVVAEYPDAGEISVYTNRIGNPDQLYTNPNIKDFKHIHDVKLHRNIGSNIQKLNGTKVIEYTPRQIKARGLSGVVILVSKKAWKQVGGFKDGFLSVDWDFTRRCKEHGLKTYLMRGVYVYHWYRGDNDGKL